MNIFGYSERGIVNALHYEMARSPNPSGVLHSFLEQATFPFTQDRPLLGDVDVLLGQSFSHFGESDAVVLIRGRQEETCSVFLEAVMVQREMEKLGLGDQVECTWEQIGSIWRFGANPEGGCGRARIEAAGVVYHRSPSAESPIAPGGSPPW